MIFCNTLPVPLQPLQQWNINIRRRRRQTGENNAGFSKIMDLLKIDSKTQKESDYDADNLRRE